MARKFRFTETIPGIGLPAGSSHDGKENSLYKPEAENQAKFSLLKSDHSYNN